MAGLYEGASSVDESITAWDIQMLNGIGDLADLERALFPELELKYFGYFFVKNRNFGLKANFLSKIDILIKNQNFRQKSKF